MEAAFLARRRFRMRECGTPAAALLANDHESPPDRGDGENHQLAGLGRRSNSGGGKSDDLVWSILSVGGDGEGSGVLSRLSGSKIKRHEGVLFPFQDCGIRPYIRKRVTVVGQRGAGNNQVIKPIIPNFNRVLR